MRWGRVEVTWGFCLMAAWINYLDRQGIFLLALAGCVLHELGHYIMIRFLGGDIKAVRLTAVGAEMELNSPMGYCQEGLAALAGPGMNLLAALLFCRWTWGRTFSGLNLVLGCFNLLPVSVMDGGRAMACTLSMLAEPELAGAVGKGMDLSFTAAMLACGVLLAGARGNFTMLLVALWLAALFFGRGKEHKSKSSRCQKFSDGCK